MTSPRKVLARRSGSVLAATACSIALLSGVAVAGGTPTPVLDRRGITEENPAASPGFLAWGEFSRRGGTTFLKPDGQRRIRLNPRGTFSSGVGIDGNTAVFDLFTPHDANLRMFHVVSQTTFAPPAGVNTPDGEYQPALSGEWLFFTRETSPTVGSRRGRIQAVLFNTVTLEERVLANLRGRTHYLVTNQVNGDWATYETCDFRGGEFSNCQVFLYRISTDTLSQIPNPGRQQYSSAVAVDGTLYFARSGNGNRWLCGKDVLIIRRQLGGAETTIGQIRPDRDVFSSFVLEEDSGVNLLLGRNTCERAFTGGIAEIANADIAT